MIDHESIKEEISDEIAKRQSEVEQIAKDAIITYWRKLALKQTFSDAQTSAERIISNFVEITPPELLHDDGDYLLSLSPRGRHGGSSTKPGNLLLNFRKLAAAVGAGGLTVTGILGPWTAILAGLALWDLLYSGLKVDLSEREAAVLWAMWKNCDLNNQIDQSAIFQAVNETLAQNGRQHLSNEELDDSLEILEKISCIERVASIRNRWWLRECVRVPYSQFIPLAATVT